MVMCLVSKAEIDCRVSFVRSKRSTNLAVAYCRINHQIDTQCIEKFAGAKQRIRGIPFIGNILKFVECFFSAFSLKSSGRGPHSEFPVLRGRGSTRLQLVPMTLHLP